ncbi:hypothetical protein BSLG_001009 [Batrachochytrium salamandrivorans]|nr:hypothetical protein BSLG_009454 [Batrachochytrium salamandrivorans]KAJ1344449.1 hypothetical protein BSLG_001009 [Batrachochytrium salamandrivorans]
MFSLAQHVIAIMSISRHSQFVLCGVNQNDNCDWEQQVASKDHTNAEQQQQQQPGRLLERLVGLCGETEHLGLARFCEHHICFLPAVQTPFGPARNDDVLLRLHATVFDKAGNFIDFPSRKWSLLHLSAAEPPKPGQRLANHRAVHCTTPTGDVIKYLEMLGYKFGFEVVRRGFAFVFGNIKITIFRLYQIQEQFRVSSAVPIHPQSTTWTVEAISPIAGQEHVVRMSEELFQFSAHLSG